MTALNMLSAQLVGVNLSSASRRLYVPVVGLGRESQVPC